MSIEALELQYQGFQLVETLVAKDSRYLRDHNRHLRLQHEESMPPRFHDESKMLASFLVNYSKAFPSDVEILFELIRIFFQPTTTAFAFVQNFLARAVSSVLATDRKKQWMWLFFVLLA